MDKRRPNNLILLTKSKHYVEAGLSTKSMHSGNDQELINIDNSILKRRVDVLSICSQCNPSIDHAHSEDCLCIAWIQASYEDIDEKALYYAMHRIKAVFDPDKPITHITMTPYRKVDVSNPDKLRKELKQALHKIGIKTGVIFELDIGCNGMVHFHAMIQGYLRKPNYILNRTGWRMHRFENDRSTLTTDFIKTASYCLQKPHTNSKAYLRI